MVYNHQSWRIFPSTNPMTHITHRERGRETVLGVPHPSCSGCNPTSSSSLASCEFWWTLGIGLGQSGGWCSCNPWDPLSWLGLVWHCLNSQFAARKPRNRARCSQTERIFGYKDTLTRSHLGWCMEVWEIILEYPLVNQPGNDKSTILQHLKCFPRVFLSNWWCPPGGGSLGDHPG